VGGRPLCESDGVGQEHTDGVGQEHRNTPEEIFYPIC
jgi:hypothetical protein